MSCGYKDTCEGMEIHERNKHTHSLIQWPEDRERERGTLWMSRDDSMCLHLVTNMPHLVYEFFKNPFVILFCWTFLTGIWVVSHVTHLCAPVTFMGTSVHTHTQTHAEIYVKYMQWHHWDTQQEACSGVVWKEQFQRRMKQHSRLLNNGREDPPLLLIGQYPYHHLPLILILIHKLSIKMGRGSGFKNKINVEVPDIFLLFDQQELPKMVAKRLAVDTLWRFSYH